MRKTQERDRCKLETKPSAMTPSQEMGWSRSTLSWESANIFWVPGARKDTARLQHPPATSWLCSDPSCWELGTSRGALISGHSVGRKRSRLCLLEHIFMQLKWHEIKLVQWRISPQTQKHQIPCLWWAMMTGLLSVWPCLHPWVWSHPNFQIQLFLYGKKD